MKIHLYQNQFKEYREMPKTGLREFSRLTNVSTTTLLKIEKGEFVNLRVINIYLNGLSDITNNTFIFVFNQK